MGCLNSESANNWHWFGNIHLSGPCNRSCYFCIGQHMLALDSLNVLDTWPLPNIEPFLNRCKELGVKDIYLTGTNTEPLLFKHSDKLKELVDTFVPGSILGLRTNGVGATVAKLSYFKKGSITICSFNPETYRKMMGQGTPPNLDEFSNMAVKARWIDLKVNVVLGPENRNEIEEIISNVENAGVNRINLREPYGQPHVGDPLALYGFKPTSLNRGQPTYTIGRVSVTYWDVHYCEVESVNLYASGRISEDYPITRGHVESGRVMDQNNFPGGRINEQWVTLRKNANV